MDGKNAKSMGSWRFSTGLLVLAVTSLFLLTGMGRQIKKDRSQDPHFSWIIGKEYRTKEDVVLNQFGGRDKIIRLTKFGDGVPTREDIGDKFPYKHKAYGDIILGVLPVGSIFRVKRVEERGHSSATFVHYFSDILSSKNEDFIGKEVDPTHLTNMSVPPRFDQKLVEELTNTANH